LHGRYAANGHGLEKDPDRRPASAAALRHRLSACDPGKKWTDERAERWWRTHLPDQGQERPVANVLLAHEAAASGAHELRPRRAGRVV